MSLAKDHPTKYDDSVDVPKKDSNNVDRPSTTKVNDNQFVIKEVLIFWTFKSDHFELRNTLPNDENVVRTLLLRSKNTLK
jgi:hypothetical protein